MTRQEQWRPPWFDELRRGEQRALYDLEQDWPGSLALIERIAGHLAERQGATDQVQMLGMVRGGIAAYRFARREGEDDPERFGCYVDGLAEALPRWAQPVVAKALSTSQRAALARRLPPSSELDSSSLSDDTGSGAGDA